MIPPMMSTVAVLIPGLTGIVGTESFGAGAGAVLRGISICPLQESQLPPLFLLWERAEIVDNIMAASFAIRQSKSDSSAIL